MFKQGERRPFDAIQAEIEALKRINKAQRSQLAEKADALATANALNQKANASTVGGLATALNSKADAADMPLPATNAPPAVGEAGHKGTGFRYALEDHTHKSTVQSKRIQVVGSSGLATWVFGQAYDAAPVVEVTAETPLNAAYVNVATVVESSTTTTQCQIQVVRVPKTITLPSLATSLLGLVLNIFAVAPAGVYVNCIARKPS